MKKIILLILFSFSCIAKKDCGEIVQKYSTDGRYFFAMKAIGGGGASNGNNGNGHVFGDVEVSIKIYQSFDIGEDYCIE